MKSKVKRFAVLGLALAAPFTINAQPTTTLFASGAAGATGGLSLNGSGISPATGNLLRHLWSSDPVNGVCRLDPDIDTPGAHNINPATCVAGAALGAGNLSFDPTTNNIYAVDQAGKSAGVLRLHFLPAADSGHGLVDKVNVQVIGAGCGIGTNTPTSATLGPDGNLYVGFKRVAGIMRIVAPQTEPLPCANVQSTVVTVGQVISGIAWVGHDLFASDKSLTAVIANADVCFTPVNGNKPCSAGVFLPALGTGVAASDQVFPSAGKDVFIGGIATVNRFSSATNSITINYGGTSFANIGGIAVDARNSAAPIVFVGDDPSAGLSPGAGRWFQISAAPPAPAPPGTPGNVTAVAGQGTATVSWTPAADGQPVTSFTVHNSTASNGVFAPDVVVTAAPGTTIVPTSATVANLTVGVTYQFEVLAGNSVGSSAFSLPSNAVTPFALSVPSAPTNTLAVAGDTTAQVVWTPPSSTGNTPITSYTVTALVAGVPTGIVTTAPGSSSGVVVGGLTDGTTYTFTVDATNAIGNSPESVPSNPVTPAPPPPVIVPDMSITMSGPATAAFQTNATYVLTVVNNTAGSTAQQVNVADTIPVGALFVSAIPSQGGCTASPGQITCQLGTMAGGAAGAIAVTLNLSGAITTQASVVALNASGAPFTDPTPANNTASVTTSVPAPTTTTDVQVTGAAQNGGPTHGTADTLTWQIKDNQSIVANAVAFTTTLPASFQFTSAAANAGAVCVTPAPGSFGGTITCRTASLPGGQTMTVVVNFIPTSIGTIPTAGAASFSGTDTNTANNSFTVTIQVK